MNSNHSQYACYRRPHPETGHLHRSKDAAKSPIGKIEYTNDPALFFHAEKYRGSNEALRIAVMEADSLAVASDILSRNPLNALQLERWGEIRERVLLCALWFAITQRTGKALGISAERFDGLDVMAATQRVQERFQNPTRLQIAGSREMTARLAGYALIDWFVENRDLAALGHGIGEHIDEVVSGNANGADSIGEEWAMRRYIPVAHFPAAWELGNHAGFLRNEEMVKVATHLLAFHIGHSKGTANMIDLFVREKKPYWKFTEDDVAKMQRKIATEKNPEDSSFTPEI
jgi:hypothetical protein